MRDNVVNTMFYTKKYNGEDSTLRDYQYMADLVSFRVGAIRLRQVRVKPG